MSCVFFFFCCSLRYNLALATLDKCYMTIFWEKKNRDEAIE
uniref:14-3-3 domain-containing protein n=1 Tax=Setaria viridis TaxID=4556 RepID=A0A4U6TUP3_SETVI|nr:hypothetical protein SEVIR_7G165503v2 [Setaria viridis]